MQGIWLQTRYIVHVHVGDGGDVGCETKYLYRGCTKLRNATNETKRNEAKYYETQRTILKCETKRNATKRNLL